MGKRPPKHSLERKDNSGNYEPSNCEWASKKTQQNNTRRNIRIEYQGAIHTLKEWSELLGIPYEVLRNRWRVGRALTKPAHLEELAKLLDEEP